MRLFTGVVKSYCQRQKLFDVYYAEDNTTERYSFEELKPCLDLFEEWYATVSNKGQRFTRKQACPIIVKSFRQQRFLDCAKEGNPSDSASATVTSSVSSATADVSKEKLGANIAVMNVRALRGQLKKYHLNDSGKKEELQQRLCTFHNVTMPEQSSTKKKQKKKHGATWVSRELAVNKARFSDDDFNDASLQIHLLGYAESKMPAPHECHNFFFTQKMWDIGRDCFNAYPRYLGSLQARPPWTPSNHPWPPTWTESPLKFNDQEYKHHTMILHLLGLKRLGRNSVRKMFSTDTFQREDWLRNLTTRRKFEGFLRQLHFEDSGDPWGKKFPHSVNYRPNGVPKVGLMQEMFRRRCVLFVPEVEMSYDEATAQYGGRMTTLKHLQSSYKPYDGIRIYCLNGSKTGYCQNFRTDLRDGTSIETMAKGVLQPFTNKGYTVWADNAFVSVSMLKWCREEGINFAGTTRTTYGFPKSLVVDNLPQGEWRWLMTNPGILAAFWSDVGNVKLMSNFHKPQSGFVLRRVSGQADRLLRTAPVLGVDYNDGMGGTDLFDFMRGLYTTLRQSKKWWKTLYHWILDTSMYNSFVLHKWVHNKFFPGRKYRLDYATFVEVVVRHFLMSTPTNSPFSTPLKRVRTVPTPPDETGPSGEVSVCDLTRKIVCPGGELELRTEKSKRGKIAQLRCKYCWNARVPRKLSLIHI